MIRHVVMLALSDDYDADALSEIMIGLANLAGVLPGFTFFEHGLNHDFEGKSAQYPYGFICTFTAATALQSYAENAEHRALGAQLVALCKGGAAGIMVIDLEVPR